MTTMTSRAGAVLGFALLAGYASAHWFALIADPPWWRWAACVVIAVAVAAALELLRGGRGRRPAAIVMAALLPLVGLAAGLAAAGVPVRLLPPAGWEELRAGLDGGLAGVSQLELPYEGPSQWTALGILLAAPVTLAVAAALAFWSPRPAGAVRRALALALLVALYAVAVTWESPSGELVHGVGLLACIGAFLWLGRLPGSRSVTAVAAVAMAGLAALPAAARVDTSDPLVNYAAWRLFGAERTASFEWNHSYGPLDWPQRGTELFSVEGADRPLYWKTTTLDDFGGAAWARGAGIAGLSTAGARLAGLEGATDRMVATHTRWVEDLDVSVLGLRSSLLVSPGTTRGVEGLASESTDPDGTTQVSDAALAEGSSYQVTSYVPSPSARLLKRRDGRRYPPGLEAFTALLLPQAHDATGIADAAAPTDPLVFFDTPLRGSGRSAGADPASLIADTPYARVRAVALRLTRDAPGTYQAVAAIERHLLENYAYVQDVPERRHPLPAFLFRDRAGYCQQFSGAMALMLRFAGIPSRVAAGFAPGLPDRETGSFTVRDTDAHSWVEVWFPEVGWVTVDPTPSAAPARTETSLTSLESSPQNLASGLGRAFEIEESAQSGRIPGGPTPERDEGGLTLRGAAALLALAGAGAAGFAYRRRRKRLLSPEGAESQVRELQRALPLIGGASGPGVTLLAMERQLAAAAGPAAARYPERLRNNRYVHGSPRRPGPTERREFRRALARATGPRGRIRALLALPPGGPRR